VADFFSLLMEDSKDISVLVSPGTEQEMVLPINLEFFVLFYRFAFSLRFVL
jgi:hypothetical protein